ASAGVCTLATLGLRAAGRLPDTTADTTPWGHWRLPAITWDTSTALRDDPVLVTVRYQVPPRHAHAFVQAMQTYGRTSRRGGAARWGVFRELEHADVFLETFLVRSWAEHLRQHERFTRGDSDVEAEVRLYIEGEPSVEHFVGAEAGGATAKGE